MSRASPADSLAAYVDALLAPLPGAAACDSGEAAAPRAESDVLRFQLVRAAGILFALPADEVIPPEAPAEEAISPGVSGGEAISPHASAGEAISPEALPAEQARPVLPAEEARFLEARQGRAHTIDLAAVALGRPATSKTPHFLALRADPPRVLAVDAVEGLVEVGAERVTWRAGGGARPWLAGMLDEPRAAVVSIPHLNEEA